MGECLIQLSVHLRIRVILLRWMMSLIIPTLNIQNMVLMLHQPSGLSLNMPIQ
ncbi:hypothetical protein A2U01_0110630, partial [Trifolium medium]|nr:hypothetical protein [Trifolium medium]